MHLNQIAAPKGIQVMMVCFHPALVMSCFFVIYFVVCLLLYIHILFLSSKKGFRRNNMECKILLSLHNRLFIPRHVLQRNLGSRNFYGQIFYCRNWTIMLEQYFYHDQLLLVSCFYYKILESFGKSCESCKES